MIETTTLALQVAGKIISPLFMTGEGLVIGTIFICGYFALRKYLNSNN
jgi:hypothetical protein